LFFILDVIENLKTAFYADVYIPFLCLGYFTREF